jgi:hypothetical protein
MSKNCTQCYCIVSDYIIECSCGSSVFKDEPTGKGYGIPQRDESDFD